jgi:hypothetical protein
MPAVAAARAATAVLVGLRILIRVPAASAVTPGRVVLAVPPPVTDTQAAMVATAAPAVLAVTASTAAMVAMRAQVVLVALARTVTVVAMVAAPVALAVTRAL